MTYDQQLRALRIVNEIARHNGIGAYAIAANLKISRPIVSNWVDSYSKNWGVYEDERSKLYLTWHHGGMEWRLPGGVVVDSNPSAVV